MLCLSSWTAGGEVLSCPGSAHAAQRTDVSCAPIPIKIRLIDKFGPNENRAKRSKKNRNCNYSRVCLSLTPPPSVKQASRQSVSWLEEVSWEQGERGCWSEQQREGKSGVGERQGGVKERENHRGVTVREQADLLKLSETSAVTSHT